MKKLGLISSIVIGYALVNFCSAQNINTVAGSANYGYAGDGGQATIAELRNPLGVIVDTSGNLYIGDFANNVVRKVDVLGVITTIAGTGTGGYNGDNIQATAAQINGPGGLGLDSAGNVYISELYGYRIRKVDIITGIITTVAGSGSGGGGGDGGQATVAQISFATDVKFDKKGNFYIADESTGRVRKVDKSGIITTIAGNGSYGFYGDGGPATAAEMADPTGVAIDAKGNVYIGDQSNNRVRMVDTSGIITTIAGIGNPGFYGDGGPATAAELNHPEELAIDAAGNLYIDDEGTSAIRMIDPSGMISTVAGIGSSAGFFGDGGSAIAAELSGPQGVCVDKSGNIFIADYGNSRVREVKNVSTGINILNNENLISVYPNPAKEQINIALNGIKGKVIITLFNIEGKQVIQQSFMDENTIAINTVGIPVGTYILRVQKNGVTTLVRKVEIQK